MAHFQGISKFVAHVGNHPIELNQLTFPAFLLFIQQLKVLVHSLTPTSNLEGQYILTQGHFVLRWPTSCTLTVCVTSVVNYYCQFDLSLYPLILKSDSLVCVVTYAMN